MPKQTIHSPIKGVSSLSPSQYALRVRAPYRSVYVVGDVHGCLSPFLHMLDDFNPHNKQLLLLNGDLINKGPDTYDVLMHVFRLKTQYPDRVHILLGNHENLFLKFLDHPNDVADLFYQAGGVETLHSFGYDTHMQTPDGIAYDLKTTYPELIKLFTTASLYFEDRHAKGINIITHAGVNLKNINTHNKHPLNHLDYTSPLEYLTIRDNFHNHSVTDLGIRFFVGHTPTTFLHTQDATCPNAIFVNPDRTVVAMDGNIHRGGQLNAVTINGSHFTTNTFMEL